MKENNKTELKVFENFVKSEEGSLLWDEHKYRHDLIWKHLIRSTVAVIALVIVTYSKNLSIDKILILLASVLAIGYVIFTYVVIKKELVLFRNIELLHRKRQNRVIGLKRRKTMEAEGAKVKDDFELRVLFYLGAQFLIVVTACVINKSNAIYEMS
ncbi:hypothetical protein [uncultured Eudoraea sp.]|uniref:hypothetical protein n=1 Tax=uncultured Eudoraea sp. TaxID=1035614 RepID=UPI00260BBD7B|nr:hypothetical protein [uncultured Eudoraea sp.]